MTFKMLERKRERDLETTKQREKCWPRKELQTKQVAQMRWSIVS